MAAEIDESGQGVHWIQSNKAFTDPRGFEKVTILPGSGDEVDLEREDGSRIRFRCRPAGRLRALSETEAGPQGLRGLWSVPWHLLAVPVPQGGGSPIRVPLPPVARLDEGAAVEVLADRGGLQLFNLISLRHDAAGRPEE